MNHIVANLSRSPNHLRLAAGLAITLGVAAAGASAQVTGHNVTKIRAGNSGRTTAYFEIESISGTQKDRKTTWAEKDARGITRFRFRETGRDRWSVYVLDSKRNVKLRLDLWQKKVVYTSARSPFPIFDILQAEAKPVRNESIHDEYYKKKTVGSGKAKAWLKAGAEFKASRATSSAEAQAVGRLSFKVLGYYGKVEGGLYGKAKGYGSSSVLSFERGIYLNGKKIYSRGRSLPREGTLSFSKDALPKDIKYRFSLGPIPITISGNVGVTVEASARLNRFDAQQIRLNATTSSSFYGRGSLDASAAEVAGVRGEARLGEVVGTGTVDVTPRSLRGKVKVELKPVSLKIEAYVRYWAFGWREATKTLFRWSKKAYTLGTHRW